MFDAMQENCQVVRQSGRSMINPKSPEHSIPPESYVEVRPVSGRVIEWGEVYCIFTASGMTSNGFILAMTMSTSSA